MLRERIEVRVRKIRLEYARAQLRVERLRKSIEAIDADPEKAGEQHLKRIKRGLGIKSRKKRSSKRKPVKRQSKKNSASSKPKEGNE